jgi:hypothetical protein
LEPGTWLAIGIMGIVALVADIIIAYVVAGRYGPSRARRLIIDDPEYRETKAMLHDIKEVALPAVRHDMEAMRTAVRQEVHNEVQHIKLPDVSPQLSYEAEEKLLRSLRGQARQAIKEAIEEELKKQTAPPEPGTVEEVGEMADAYKLAEYLVREHGVPEPLALKAYSVGKLGLFALADRLGIELPEALDATQGLYR